MDEKLIELVDAQIKCVIDNGINATNIDYLGDLVDIHKDISNEKYWKMKEEDIKMRYSNYGRENYGRDGYGNDGYGRGNYGREQYGRRRRDSRGRYMHSGGQVNEPEEYIEKMKEQFMDYRDGMEEYHESGNYGAKDDSMKSLEYMLDSLTEFGMKLYHEAAGPEEKEMIKEKLKELKEMMR